MYNNVDENASLRCEDFTRCTCEWSTLFSKRGLIQWPSAHTVSAQVEPSSIPSAFHHSANTKTAAWEVHQRITDKKKRKEKLAFPFFHSTKHLSKQTWQRRFIRGRTVCCNIEKKKSSARMRCERAPRGRRAFWLSVDVRDLDFVWN